MNRRAHVDTRFRVSVVAATIVAATASCDGPFRPIANDADADPQPSIIGGDAAEPSTPGTECSPGSRSSCWCPGGGTGEEECTKGGTRGACVCRDAGAGVDAGCAGGCAINEICLDEVCVRVCDRNSECNGTTCCTRDKRSPPNKGGLCLNQARTNTGQCLCRSRGECEANGNIAFVACAPDPMGAVYRCTQNNGGDYQGCHLDGKCFDGRDCVEDCRFNRYCAIRNAQPCPAPPWKVVVNPKCANTNGQPCSNDCMAASCPECVAASCP